MTSESIIEGTVKFRDGKKWKSRWCVMQKLSPVADCLHLQLYRDSKDRYKQGQTKASLSLQHFLGLESGFTLDKESHTIAILCRDVVVVLAFDNRERLMQWQVKLSTHLGDGPHFLVLVSSAPGRSRLPPGPARLHVQGQGFCLATGIPPRVAREWLIGHLRRYGVVEGRFCFEGGSRCGRGEGLFVLLTDKGEEITSALKMAAMGQLHATRKRPVSRNMSVIDSPRKINSILQRDVVEERSRNGLVGAIRQHALAMTDLNSQRADSPYTDLESNYDCGDSVFGETWNPPTIERCMSCISKLGALSRSSTAATVAIAPPPSFWPENHNPISATLQHYPPRVQSQIQHQHQTNICDFHAGGGSGSDTSSRRTHTTGKPPARPPKPPANSSTPKRTASPNSICDNYDIPKPHYPMESPPTCEYYDTPRKLKECLVDTVHKPCGCIVRIKQEIDRPCICQRLITTCWSTCNSSTTFTVSTTTATIHTEDISALYATVDKSKKIQRAPSDTSSLATVLCSSECYRNYVNLGPDGNNSEHCAETQTEKETIPSTAPINYENIDFEHSLDLYENSKQLLAKVQESDNIAGDLPPNLPPKCCSKCDTNNRLTAPGLSSTCTTESDYLVMGAPKASALTSGYVPMSPAVKQRLHKLLSNSNPNLMQQQTKPASGAAMLLAGVYQRKHMLDSADDIKRKRSNSADSGREEVPIHERSPCHCSQAVRRSSSVPCKTNRDSSCSNDSGVFELPRRIIQSPSNLPRRSKSSDPLQDLNFCFNGNKEEAKNSSAEAEVPMCPTGSTSSGTSDMSDYFETLSVSSHSSSDNQPPPSCTLRPRSGNEYLTLQRLIAPVPEERLS